MTKQEILKAAELKGWETQTHTSSTWQEEIGFSTGKGVWYWFKKCSVSDNMRFDQRYSCNNGKTSRGFRAGYRANEMVQAALNPNLERFYS